MITQEPENNQFDEALSNIASRSSKTIGETLGIPEEAGRLVSDYLISSVRPRLMNLKCPGCGVMWDVLEKDQTSVECQSCHFTYDVSQTVQEHVEETVTGELANYPGFTPALKKSLTEQFSETKDILLSNFQSLAAGQVQILDKLDQLLTADERKEREELENLLTLQTSIQTKLGDDRNGRFTNEEVTSLRRLFELALKHFKSEPSLLPQLDEIGGMVQKVLLSHAPTKTETEAGLTEQEELYQYLGSVLATISLLFNRDLTVEVQMARSLAQIAHAKRFKTSKNPRDVEQAAKLFFGVSELVEGLPSELRDKNSISHPAVYVADAWFFLGYSQTLTKNLCLAASFFRKGILEMNEEIKQHNLADHKEVKNRIGILRTAFARAKQNCRGHPVDPESLAAPEPIIAFPEPTPLT